MDISIFGDLDDTITLCGFPFFKGPFNPVLHLTDSGAYQQAQFRR